MSFRGKTSNRFGFATTVAAATGISWLASAASLAQSCPSGQPYCYFDKMNFLNQLNYSLYDSSGQAIANSNQETCGPVMATMLVQGAQSESTQSPKAGSWTQTSFLAASSTQSQVQNMARLIGTDMNGTLFLQPDSSGKPPGGELLGTAFRANDYARAVGHWQVQPYPAYVAADYIQTMKDPVNKAAVAFLQGYYQKQCSPALMSLSQCWFTRLDGHFTLMNGFNSSGDLKMYDPYYGIQWNHITAVKSNLQPGGEIWTLPHGVRQLSSFDNRADGIYRFLEFWMSLRIDN